MTNKSPFATKEVDWPSLLCSTEKKFKGTLEICKLLDQMELKFSLSKHSGIPEQKIIFWFQATTIKI